jgi:ParB-like chromosome segregation protein Spo0J
MSDSSSSLIQLKDGQRLSVPSNKLIVSEWNLRKRDIKGKKWEEWIASLRDRGQEKPITIATLPIEKDGSEYYEIIDGQLRFLGMREIEGDEVFFMDCEAKLFESEEDIIAYAIHTHQERRDLSFADYRWAIEHLIDRHNSIDDVAKIICKSRWWIQGILATRSYAEEIKLEIDQSQIDPSSQRELAKIFKDREKEVTKETIKEVSDATTRELKDAKKMVEKNGVDPNEAIKKAKSKKRKKKETVPEPAPTSVPASKEEVESLIEKEPSELPTTKESTLDDFEVIPATMFVSMDDSWVPKGSKVSLSPEAYNKVNAIAKNNDVHFNEALNMIVLNYQ